MFKLTPNSISYRDNAARVVKEGGIYFRYISYSYRSEYDHLMESGLYKKLTDKGFLISHKEVDFNQKNEDPNTTLFKNVYKKLLPDQIDFQSYPFEWSYGQWRKAIFTYLKINEVALQFSMILKDATPFNFVIKEGKAVLLDTSSFIFFNEGDQWIAYRQFCMEFLSPLALMHFNGERWSLISRSQLSGFPLNFVSKQLPIRSWLNISCLLHIHFHSRFSNEITNSGRLKLINNAKKWFNKEKISFLIISLQKTVKNWNSAYQYEDHWKSYYENSIESDKYMEDKEKIVKEWLAEIKPKRVLDLGANTGKFSFVACNYSTSVISIEQSDSCVDMIEKYIVENGIRNINALKNDITNPTPNQGLLGEEFSSLINRVRSSTVLGLAIIHHLALTKHLNFNLIAKLFSDLSEKFIIIEFIGEEDKMVKLLIQNNNFYFNNYKEQSFLFEFKKYFKLIEKKEIKDSYRSLYLFQHNI